MKITVERTVLLRALSHVQSVVERRNTIPILSNILLVANDGELALTATDMDLEVVETVPANVEAPGSVTVSVATFYDIVRKLPDDATIELSTNDDNTQLKLVCGRSDFNLGILPAQDFPLMSHDGFENQFEIPADDLKLLIDRTKFSMSTEETRFYLNGIYLHVCSISNERGGKVLRAVATDGHRLARSQVILPQGADAIPSVILPRKMVGELRKLIDDAVDNVTVSLSETKIQVAFDSIVLRSKLIDGTFPEYERVVPANNHKKFLVPARALAKAVDRVATLSNEKSRAIKMHINGKQLTLSANSATAGSAIEELEIVEGGENIEIGFNARYVLDILQQIKGDNLQFEVSNAATPIIITEVSDTRPLYVLMPMRMS